MSFIEEAKLTKDDPERIWQCVRLQERVEVRVYSLSGVNIWKKRPSTCLGQECVLIPTFEE